MQKIAQKVTSITLAASMLLSMFSVNTVAFADEFKNETTVSDDATDVPASEDEVNAVDSNDETDTSNSAKWGRRSRMSCTVLFCFGLSSAYHNPRILYVPLVVLAFKISIFNPGRIKNFVSSAITQKAP